MSFAIIYSSHAMWNINVVYVVELYRKFKFSYEFNYQLYLSTYVILLLCVLYFSTCGNIQFSLLENRIELMRSRLGSAKDDTWPLCVNQTERRWYYLQGRATSVVSWTKGPTPKTGELGGDQKREEGRERKWTRGNEKLVDGKLRMREGEK